MLVCGTIWVEIDRESGQSVHGSQNRPMTMWYEETEELGFVGRGILGGNLSSSGNYVRK